MKSLGIFPQTIRQFRDNGYVSISEPPFGAFYWAENEDLKRIRDFEDSFLPPIRYRVPVPCFYVRIQDSYRIWEQNKLSLIRDDLL